MCRGKARQFQNPSQIDCRLRGGRSAAGGASSGPSGGAGRPGDARPLVQAVLQLQPGFRVTPMIAHQAFRDDDQREQYGRHLIAAGLPP